MRGVSEASEVPRLKLSVRQGPAPIKYTAFQASPIGMITGIAASGAGHLWLNNHSVTYSHDGQLSLSQSLLLATAHAIDNECSY